MRLSEARELASSYKEKFTNLGDNIYIFAPMYDSYEGVFVRLSIKRDIIPASFELFGFDSFREAHNNHHDWYDIKQ